MAEFLEGKEEDETKTMEQTIKNKENEMYNLGYADGVKKGQEEQFQEGFNKGFKEGDGYGKCIGIINASLSVLDLCFRNPGVDEEIKSKKCESKWELDKFDAWKGDIAEYLIPPKLELKESEYAVIKPEQLSVIMNRIKDMFCALKMNDCVMMKLLETISI